MIETKYEVTGMSCGHCAAKVTAAFTGLPGVDGVDVDVEQGTATVRSQALLSIDDVRIAIEEAGHSLADTP